MAASLHFKRGWECEKLAEYILSRFSFVAKPSTVSDDLGTDLFCTLFRVEERKGRDYPLPLNSFAIQIKSNKRTFDFSSNISYLQNLEIPFFCGVISENNKVINENNKQLSVFSGENLPVFFSHVGKVSKLKIKMLERNKMSDLYDPKEVHKDKYTVMFPKILDIKLDSTEKEERNGNVDKLQEMCSRIQRNISTRKIGEYLFESHDGQSYTILAGPDSDKHYRDNFMKRLAENFYNLQWRNEYYPDERKHIIEEFKIYEDVFLKIQKFYPEIHPYLKGRYERIKSILFKS